MLCSSGLSPYLFPKQVELIQCYGAHATAARSQAFPCCSDFRDNLARPKDNYVRVDSICCLDLPSDRRGDNSVSGTLQHSQPILSIMRRTQHSEHTQAHR